jgi:hypothetical protein
MGNQDACRLSCGPSLPGAVRAKQTDEVVEQLSGNRVTTKMTESERNAEFNDRA